MKTHYDILGVPPNADYETVKAAYRKIVKAFHPDLHDGDSSAELRSKQIIAAYAVLKDEESRARYDEHLQHRRSRLRMFVITVLVSAGLVSGSTLFFLNFLLKPNADAPVARISTSATEKTALAEDTGVAGAKGPALAPREATDASPEESAAPPPPPTVAEASPPERAAPLPENQSTYETAWLKIDKNGDAEAIWVFMRRHAGTPHAALAEKRLEPLIDAIDDIDSLKALAAKASGGVAERVRARLEQLAPRKDDVTNALPEPTAEAPQPETAPAAGAASDTHAPEPAQPRAAHDEGGAKLASTDPQSAVHHAFSLMTSGQIGMATPMSRDSASITRGNAKYYVHRAGFWAGKGDLDRALADYDAAILVDGANIAAFHGRGLLRWRRGEVELALADFDQAIRLSFADPKIYLDRGQIWYERGRYDRAIADFNQAIKLAPHLADAYSYRGTALRRKREFKSAIADLDQAILLNPAISGAYRNRELARTERDDPVEAIPETSR